jgi:hypothetical protein
VGFVLEIEKSKEGRSQFLAVGCRVREKGGSSAVILTAVDLAEAAGTDGVGCRNASQYCQPCGYSRHLDTVWFL